jgi:hypothetical protein
MNSVKNIQDEILDTTIGIPGRMISGSKSGYRRVYPGNAPVFNSNLVVMENGEPTKIWHGDVDLTVDHEKLLKLSEAMEKEIFVLYEMHGRFENEKRPLVEKYIASYDFSRAKKVVISKDYEQYFELDGNVIKEKNS